MNSDHHFFSNEYFLLVIQSTYESILTKDTQTYSRVCGRTNYHYETIQVSVQENNIYRFDSNNTIITYGYIYKDSFDPYNPTENLLAQSNFTCGRFHFELATYLEANKTYILVVTTFESNVRGEFSVLVYGSSNVTLNRLCKYVDTIMQSRCTLKIENTF